jgi:SpoVK/Ycf46/Vps4 family AAA+-type ATPase
MSGTARPSVYQQGIFSVSAPRFDLEEHVVLTQATAKAIEECIALFRHHETIYSDWGFADVDPLGRSATVNFYGPPGTGKTMAAEALAGSLGMTFLALNIVDLESSLKGEMSKNIQAAFELAYEEDALLFFDEADALLGRRIAVSQGIDNDINATRNTFMTELNKHEGLVVFATNFPRDYDEAILSRITHQIYFELPDIPARRRLWSKFLVEGIPLAVDREELIDEAVEVSAGLAGRDILQAVRRALPAALREAEIEEAEAMLATHHVLEAVEAIKRRYRKYKLESKPVESDPEAAAALKRTISLG